MKAAAVLRKIKHYCQFLALKIKIKAHQKKNKSCIFMISTPVHGNMGDQAIVYAQYKLLSSVISKSRIVEITRWQYHAACEWLPGVIREKDIIIIDGGGNIGTLWQAEENKMRDIIQRFPRNPIFIFPQSAFFENSEKGERELEKSRNIYCKHEQLTVFCRDHVTYELLQKKFEKVRSFYTPDMVPYIQDAENAHNRQGVLLCLRNDAERTQRPTFENEMVKCLQAANYQVKTGSTLVAGKVTKRNRAAKLKKKWAEFSSAQLVITDRLHGMIFSAITATPCLAFDNISHKVRDGYAWLRHLPYISFCENEEEMYKKIDGMVALAGAVKYERAPLERYYTIIQKEIKNAII